jgi:hypothetical protein
MPHKRIYVRPLDIHVDVDDRDTERVFQQVRPMIPNDWCTGDRSHYGYPGDLVLCVTDALWSIGVNYEKHVVPVVKRVRAYRTLVGQPLKTPSAFLDHFREHLNDRGGWLAVNLFENRQMTSTAVSAWRKAYAIQQTLEVLRRHQVETPADLLAQIHNRELRRELEAVPGDAIGVRTDYLFMLAGSVELAKFDRQISRFLELQFNSRMRLQAIALLTTVADRLRDEFPCMNTRTVDHFIWQAMSGASDSFESAVATEKLQASGAGATIPPRRPPTSDVDDAAFANSPHPVDCPCTECVVKRLRVKLAERAARSPEANRGQSTDGHTQSHNGREG